jgi:predicted RNA-binding Zn-ribbon protein involved in translation (DUF1610 family)
MAISFSCQQCGKKLNAPDDAVGKTSRCPQCGTPVTCPEPIYDAELVDFPPDEMGQYADVSSGEPYAVAAPVPGAAAPEAPTGEARRPCPMCGEMIVATAAKCRFCGEIFDPALVKARSSKRYGSEDSSLTGGELALALLCSGIGCIFGLIWVIQGRPKGGKMLAISVVMAIFWNVIFGVLQAIGERGGP